MSEKIYEFANITLSEKELFKLERKLNNPYISPCFLKKTERENCEIIEYDTCKRCNGQEFIKTIEKTQSKDITHEIKCPDCSKRPKTKMVVTEYWRIDWVDCNRCDYVHLFIKLLEGKPYLYALFQDSDRDKEEYPVDILIFDREEAEAKLKELENENQN